MLLAFFAIGDIAAGRLGKYLDKNSRGCGEPQKPGRKVCIAGTEGKDIKTISQEVSSMLDALPDDEEYEIIICQSPDPYIIDYLKASGCTIKNRLRL